MLLSDPWGARDGYIDVILDRSPESVDRFLGRHAPRLLSPADRTRALKLLEMQRHAQLMYTSCGWFFDDVSGIEARQIIQYAGRALQLSRDLFPGADLEAPFLEALGRARSNLAEARDGRRIYEESVRPAMVSLERVGAHYAVHSLFSAYGEEAEVYSYRVEREDYHLAVSGRSRLALGRVRVTSKITEESGRVVFGILHLGDHNLSGGVSPFTSEEDYAALVAEISEPFAAADLTETLRLVDRRFGPGVYSLRLLFRDEQRQVVRELLKSALEETDAVYRRLYEEHAPLMRFLSGHGVRQPRGFAMAAERALATSLREALGAPAADVPRMRAILDEAGRAGIALHEDGLGLAFEQALERLGAELAALPEDVSRLETLEGVVALAKALPFDVDFAKVQNTYYALARTALPAMRRAAGAGTEGAAQWVAQFLALGENLSVRVAEDDA